MNARVLLLAAAVLSAGCGGAARHATLETPRRSVVAVSNHNWATAKLYLVQDNGMRVRLATIETGTQERVYIPRMVDAFGQSVGFEVELVGSTLSYEIAPVMLSPGDVIRITIENNLNLSSIMVMP